MSYFNPSKRAPKITVLPGPGSVEPASNRRLYLAIVGGAVVALWVGGGFKLWQHRQSSQASLSSPEEETLALSESDSLEAMESGDSAVPGADLAMPFVATSPSLTLAEPALLQSTSSQVRLPAIAAGRPDPFAPLVIPSSVPARPTPALLVAPPPPPGNATPVVAAPASPPPVAIPSPAQSLPPLPTVTIASLPVPTIPGGLLPSPEGTMAMAPAVEIALESVVDQVTISGVMQIGSQVHAIVIEPSSPSGRRVSQGDTVAGGQVRVKAIDLSGVDPTVVLTYNGRDYFRTVSGASAQ
ncbi:MAG: hypothetical protein VKI82_10550 [Leptolyngbya sp.]|nr:hypothetical protein [Leptolyngbya sp.]